jgi:serine protease inhibitor
MKMTIKSAALCIVLSAILGSAPAKGAQSGLETLARDNTAFALSLYGKLAPAEGNLIFSPYSISTALGMTYAGARGNTEKEMAAALHFSLNQAELHAAFGRLEGQLKKAERNGIRLSVANALWPQKDYPFLEDFLSLAKKHYGVLITPLDYRTAREPARETINRWVEKRTENKITDLLQPADLSDLTRMVLVNAIYFKGKWASQFKPGNTQSAPFHVSPDKAVQTPMMTQKLECRYTNLPQMDILELPYVGGALSMIVLLPKEIDGIQKVERELSADSLAKWLTALDEQEVLVFLPRFKATGRFGLNDTLASMGMVDAFSDTKANFAGMDGRTDWLYISAAIHKAFVEVNEEGTEAAAATAVVMTERSVPARPPTFRADHPFIFLIQEKGTGSILFMGRLSDPTKQGE